MIIGGIQIEKITVLDKKGNEMAVLSDHEGVTCDKDLATVKVEAPAMDQAVENSLVKPGEELVDEKGTHFMVYHIGSQFFNCLKWNQELGEYDFLGQRTFPNGKDNWTLEEFGLHRLEEKKG